MRRNIHPQEALTLLPRVDPARLRYGWPIGLRDGAVLTLLGAGLTLDEILLLRAADIVSDRGQLQVRIRRLGFPYAITLHSIYGGRVLAWLSDRRLWASPDLLCTCIQGPLTGEAVRQILYRYRHEPERRR
jgi:hypothetical protein